MPAFCAFVCTHSPGEDHTGFDDDALEHVKEFFTEVGLFSNALNRAGRVAQNDEAQVVVSTRPFDPTHEFDRLTVVLAVLHIAYPSGLDHALTAQTHRTGLCICLPSTALKYDLL